MAIFPWYDNKEVTKHFSPTELGWLAFLQYLMVALCLATLGLIVLNGVTILVKQGKYNVIPLVNFYLLATLLVICRICDQFFMWPVIVYEWIIMYLLGQSLKFVLGLQQVWINCELISSMRHSMRLVKEGNTEFPARFFYLGRIFIVIFTSLFLLIVIIVSLVKQFQLDHDEWMHFGSAALIYFVPVMQITAAALMTSSIVVILVYSSKLESVTDDVRAFHQEKRRLTDILIIFDSSYLLRMLYDIMLGR